MKRIATILTLSLAMVAGVAAPALAQDWTEEGRESHRIVYENDPAALAVMAGMYWESGAPACMALATMQFDRMTRSLWLLDNVRVSADPDDDFPPEWQGFNTYFRSQFEEAFPVYAKACDEEVG